MGALEFVCILSAGLITISWDCGNPLPCPRFNWKDLLAFIAAGLGAFVCISILPGLKDSLTSMDAVFCIVGGVASGRFIKRALCPIPWKK